MIECQWILTLACEDKRGIVAKVTESLFSMGGFITNLQQHGDEDTNRFFMRCEFKTESISRESFQKEFEDSFYEIATLYSMHWTLSNHGEKMPVLLLVSKYSHCLNDLLYRMRFQDLPIDVKAVASNHTDLKEMVDWYDIPFYHCPVDKETKEQQEKQLIEIADHHQVELIVLARYMQILSSNLCDTWKGKAINIHHSFLPSFKGAKPYHQAHKRGVKMIGATAHYVTADLDEGPIIEQDIQHVGHSHTAIDLVKLGKDVEAKVLAKAVKNHAEHRIFLSDHRTVIFD